MTYLGMVLGAFLIGYFTNLVSLGVLDGLYAANMTVLYPLIHGLILFGFVVPFYIYYGTSLTAELAGSAFAYNAINREWNWVDHKIDAFVALGRILIHLLGGAVAGWTYQALIGGVVVNPIVPIDNVLASPFATYLLFTIIVVMLHHYSMMIIDWTRDAFGALVLFGCLYIGISYGTWFIARDVVDFSTSLAVSAAANNWTIRLLWLFLSHIIGAILTIVLYWLIWSRRITTMGKATNNNGDAVEGETMLNIRDPPPVEDTRMTACVRPRRPDTAAGPKKKMMSKNRKLQQQQRLNAGANMKRADAFQPAGQNPTFRVTAGAPLDSSE